MSRQRPPQEGTGGAIAASVVDGHHLCIWEEAFPVHWRNNVTCAIISPIHRENRWREDGQVCYAHGAVMIVLVTLVKGWHVGGVRHWLSQADPTPANAFEAHYRLVSIHPFSDGNGRTARLLMNLLLLRGAIRLW